MYKACKENCMLLPNLSQILETFFEQLEKEMLIKNTNLKKAVRDLEEQKRKVITQLRMLNIPIPKEISDNSVPYFEVPSAVHSPIKAANIQSSDFASLPSTSSGIYAAHIESQGRRCSAEVYRPPPPYRPPRRYSSEVPFGRYQDHSGTNMAVPHNLPLICKHDSSESMFFQPESPLNIHASTQNVDNHFCEDDDFNFLEDQTLDLAEIFTQTNNQCTSGQFQQPQAGHQICTDGYTPMEEETKPESVSAETNQEVRMIQQLFIPLFHTEDDDATVPDVQESDSQCPTTPTFY